jgi:hypothetical protein
MSPVLAHRIRRESMLKTQLVAKKFKPAVLSGLTLYPPVR